MSARKANELSTLQLVVQDLLERVLPHLDDCTETERGAIVRQFRGVYGQLHNMFHDETSALGLGCLAPGAKGYPRQELIKLAERLPR